MARRRLWLLALLPWLPSFVAPLAPPRPPLVARRALPEASLLLADLQPTPAVVSGAFNVITFMPQRLGQF